MAPIRKRTTLRTRAARSARDPRGIYAPPSPSAVVDTPDEDTTEVCASFSSTQENSLKRKGIFEDEFKVTKKDKRTIKHNQLLDKVRDSGVRKNTLKRRRPGNKMKTELDTLADALPDVEDSDDDDGWEGLSDNENEVAGGMELDGLRKAGQGKKKSAARAENAKMTMKSVRNRPGAMKRKKVMEGKEMERFAKNLAQMAAPPAQQAASSTTATPDTNTAGSASSQSDRWKALRNFLGQTMETNKSFGKK